MHEVFEKYSADPRMLLAGAPPSKLGITPDVAKCYLYAKDQILSSDWHWLKYHYSTFPPLQTTLEIAEICVLAEYCETGLGKAYVDGIAAIKDREKNERDYEAILQIFSEMLVLDQVLQMPWADDVEFSYEPAGKTDQRPELRVVSEGKRYLFEVKAPSLLDHVRKRQEVGWQIPGKILPKEGIQAISRGEPIVLPRDNPVKDFLNSAEKKFSDFDEEDGANILVIVWDDYVYEPITSLANEHTGLLTTNTFYRDDAGKPINHPSVDAVIIVRHLTYFFEGLAERPLPDRRGAFDFGSPDDLPNISVQSPWGRPVPSLVSDGLRAVDVKDDRIQHFAEYKPIEIVMWLGQQ